MDLESNYADHYIYLQKYLASCFEKEECLDVTFVCKGGEQVKAHALVLAAVSPFLRSILNENTAPDLCITLSEVDHWVVTDLLTLMYEGTMKLPASDMQEFQELMTMLGIKFPGSVYIYSSPGPVYRRCTSQNGLDESPGLIVDTPNDTGDPNDDPLNIPDRYFIQPKPPASGQLQVKSVKRFPEGSKSLASAKLTETRRSEASTSTSGKRAVETRSVQTGVGTRTRQTTAANESTYQGTSNGPVAATSRSSAMDKGDPGGRKRKQAENEEERPTRKVTRSKDKQ